MKAYRIAYLSLLPSRIGRRLIASRILPRTTVGMLGLVLGLSAVQPVCAAPLAILTDVRGGVQIVRGASKMAGRNGAKLEAGDVVRVDKGAATVYYVTRPPQMLKANQQVKVAAAGSAVNKPSLWRNVYAGIASGFARRAQNTPGVVRKTEVQLIWPINGTVLQSRPSFYWSHNHPKPAFHLVIKNADDAVIWQGTSTVARIDYPAAAPALRPGQKYFWEAMQTKLDENGQVVLNPVDSFLSAKDPKNAVFFRVGTGKDSQAAQSEADSIRRAMVRSTDAQRRFALAAALDRRGFYNEAIAQLIPEVFAPNTVAQGNLKATLETVVPHLNESTRSLLRGLWYATKQEHYIAKVLKQPIEYDPKFKRKN